MPIDIRDFKGTAPSIAKQSLADGMATIANNCRLGSSEVRPCSRMRPDHNIDATALSIYRHDGTWIEKAEKGWRFAPAPVETDPQRLYMTSPSGGAIMWVDGVETKLGVVPPLAAPSVSASGGSGTAETRVYVFTCVSEHGEESAPSPASSTVDALPGGSVSLTGMNTPSHTDYADITKKRIYRSAVGSSGAAAYFFVAEIDAVDTTYSDSVSTTDLGEELPSLGWAIPPAGLKGLVQMTGGFFAGFSGRELRLCEPWQPHAWPDAYAHTLQHDIVQLGVFGRTLFAMTTGPVYTMTVNDIAAAVPEAMPGDVPCSGQTAVVDTPAGVVFASLDGLYICTPGSQSPVLLTRGLYTERDWQKLNPDTMFGAWHADQLFVFYDDVFGRKGGLIFDSLVTESPVLRFTDTEVVAATVVPDGRILFVEVNNAVYEWEGDSSFGMDATWASKEYVTPVPANFAAAIVEADFDAAVDAAALADELALQRDVVSDLNGGMMVGGLGMLPVGMVPFASDLFGMVVPFFDPATFIASPVEFKLFGDGVLRHTEVVSDELPFALPAGYLARRWIVQVRGNVNIKRVAVGESIAEIYS